MKKLIVVLIVSALLINASLAIYGTRPAGMGGAFTAVADDANAPYWNPAGEALNPEVSATGSYRLNNRNITTGDNTANLKFCYETEMNPFLWIAGVGVASIVALEGAKYLSNQGTVQKNWGRDGDRPSRDEAVTNSVQGSTEVVSLKQSLKEEIKKLANKTTDTAKSTAKEVVKNTDVNVTIGMMPIASPWYNQDFGQPHYWEQPSTTPPASKTKAQFALGLSLLTDNNPTMDQKSNWYSVTVASGFEQRFAVGMGVNFYDLTKLSTDIRGIGADLDLGVIARPVSYISLGLATKGILTTDFHWQNGQVTRGYEMLVNAGIAAKPIQALTLAADVQNLFKQNGRNATMHYGAELAVFPWLIGRAGLDDNSKTAGASIAIGPLILDYAYLGGVYNRTQMVGANWRF
jgi:hypothetical protein